MSEYIMERFHRNVSEAPNAPLFYDDTHPNGITFRQFDEMSARVYGWLKKQGIGREDFVLIHLPRGLTPFAVAAGVWKAGAAFDGGSAVLDKSFMTTVPGLFAAGDCTGGTLQVAVAVGEGAIAGLAAIKYLRENKA